MEVDLYPGLAVSLSIRSHRIARVEETGAVGQPRGVGKLGEGDDILQILAGAHLPHAPAVPVRPPIRGGVGHVLPVRTHAHSRQSHGRVLTEAVRIDEDPGFGVQAFGHEDHVLVLEAIVSREEVEPSFLLRDTEALVVPEGGETLDGFAARPQALQEGLCQAVLGIHPGGHLGALEILHPPVGVSHWRPEVLVAVV
jgi:hypothetical protein